MGTLLHKHDVKEGNWEYLLQDLVAWARLSNGQCIVAGVLPVVRRLDLLGPLRVLPLSKE
jgi:hypothetical protein